MDLKEIDLEIVEKNPLDYGETKQITVRSMTGLTPAVICSTNFDPVRLEQTPFYIPFGWFKHSWLVKV